MIHETDIVLVPVTGAVVSAQSFAHCYGVLAGDMGSPEVWGLSDSWSSPNRPGRDDGPETPWSMVFFAANWYQVAALKIFPPRAGWNGKVTMRRLFVSHQGRKILSDLGRQQAREQPDPGRGLEWWQVRAVWSRQGS